MKFGVPKFGQGFTRALPGLVYRIPPVRPSGWDLKDQWRACGRGTSAYRRVLLVVLRAADVEVSVMYGVVLRMFGSQSIQITDDIW